MDHQCGITNVNVTNVGGITNVNVDHQVLVVMWWNTLLHLSNNNNVYLQAQLEYEIWNTPIHALHLSNNNNVYLQTQLEYGIHYSTYVIYSIVEGIVALV